MHVLLFFIAVLIAGVAAGLALILTTEWWLAGVVGYLGLWVTEGLFERHLGYRPHQPKLGQDNLQAH